MVFGRGRHARWGQYTVIPLMPGYWHPPFRRRFVDRRSGQKRRSTPGPHTVDWCDAGRSSGSWAERWTSSFRCGSTASRLFLGSFSYQGVALWLKPGATLEQANADVGRMLRPAWWAGVARAAGLVERSSRPQRESGRQLTPLKQDVVGDIRDTLWGADGDDRRRPPDRLRERRRSSCSCASKDGGGGWLRVAALTAPALVANRHAETAARKPRAWSRAGGVLGLAVAVWRAEDCSSPSVRRRCLDFGTSRSIPRSPGFTLAGVTRVAGAALRCRFPVLVSGPGAIAERASRRRRRLGISRPQPPRTPSRATLLVVVMVALALVLLVASEPDDSDVPDVAELCIPASTARAKCRDAGVSIPQIRRGRSRAAWRGSTTGSVERSAAVPDAEGSGRGQLGTRSKRIQPAPIPSRPKIRRIRLWAESAAAAIQDSSLPNCFHTWSGSASSIAGRDFTWTDVFDDRRVAVVSEDMAREMAWGGTQPALGKTHPRRQCRPLARGRRRRRRRVRRRA